MYHTNVKMEIRTSRQYFFSLFSSFLCLRSLLYYCRLSFAKCCLAFLLFSIGFACLASCAWTSQQKRPRPFLIRSLMRNLPHLSRSMSRGQLKKRNRRGNRNKKRTWCRQKGGEKDEGKRKNVMRDWVRAFCLGERWELLYQGTGKGIRSVTCLSRQATLASVTQPLATFAITLHVPESARQKETSKTREFRGAWWCASVFCERAAVLTWRWMFESCPFSS